MVRFGTIISIDRAMGSAVIRDSADSDREFLVMGTELSQMLVEDRTLKTIHLAGAKVSFVRDPDFQSTDVAFLVKVHKRGRVAA